MKTLFLQTPCRARSGRGGIVRPVRTTRGGGYYEAFDAASCGSDAVFFQCVGG